MMLKVFGINYWSRAVSDTPVFLKNLCIFSRLPCTSLFQTPLQVWKGKCTCFTSFCLLHPRLKVPWEREQRNLTALCVLALSSTLKFLFIFFPRWRHLISPLRTPKYQMFRVLLLIRSRPSHACLNQGFPVNFLRPSIYCPFSFHRNVVHSIFFEEKHCPCFWILNGDTVFAGISIICLYEINKRQNLMSCVIYAHIIEARAQGYSIWRFWFKSKAFGKIDGISHTVSYNRWLISQGGETWKLLSKWYNVGTTLCKCKRWWLQNA